eukprot:TRINITY_DN16103_c2_g1_i1.p1 TRINITY_DN16103_c2_g1~~TRINITY_DN16103_c2_g1_i1.p1  ORF type:complete len:419 (-),score=58.70 TRINITY_DN16103_c2_g1_i1:166-1422(-)
MMQKNTRLATAFEEVGHVSAEPTLTPMLTKASLGDVAKLGIKSPAVLEAAGGHSEIRPTPRGEFSIRSFIQLVSERSQRSFAKASTLFVQQPSFFLTFLGLIILAMVSFGVAVLLRLGDETPDSTPTQQIAPSTQQTPIPQRGFSTTRDSGPVAARGLSEHRQWTLFKHESSSYFPKTHHISETNLGQSPTQKELNTAHAFLGEASHGPHDTSASTTPYQPIISSASHGPARPSTTPFYFDTQKYDSDRTISNFGCQGDIIHRGSTIVDNSPVDVWSPTEAHVAPNSLRSLRSCPERSSVVGNYTTAEAAEAEAEAAPSGPPLPLQASLMAATGTTAPVFGDQFVDGESLWVGDNPTQAADGSTRTAEAKKSQKIIQAASEEAAGVKAPRLEKTASQAGFRGVSGLVTWFAKKSAVST